MKKTISAMFMASLMLVTIFSVCFTVSAVSRTNDMNIIDMSSVSEDGSGGGVAKWTFIAYLDGDNNLDDYIIEILNNMEMVGSTDDVEIVAQIDTYAKTRRYHVTYDDDIININSEEITNWGDGIGAREVNMGHPDTLSDFVCWAIGNYTAEHYFLMLCDHGQGWDGICYDYSSLGDCLTLKDLKNAFGIINEHLKDKIDVVWFNACGMGTLEVYYELKDSFDLGISSEDLGYFHPEMGALPRLSLNALNEAPNINPTDIAILTAENCVEYNELSGNSSYRDASVIDPSADKIDEIVEKTNNLAMLLIEKLSEYKSNITTAVQHSPCFDGPVINFFKRNYQIDLYVFAYQIKEKISNPEIQDAAQDVMDAITETELVVNSFSTHEPHQSQGFSVLEPSFTLEEDKSVPDDYLDLDFAKHTQWDEFVYEFSKKSKDSSNTKSLPLQRVVRSFTLEADDNLLSVVLKKLFTKPRTTTNSGSNLINAIFSKLLLNQR